LRVEAANAHGAAIGIAQTLEDFDGGGFAGAIGAEQPKTSPSSNREAESAHGLHIAVMFTRFFLLAEQDRA